MSIGRFAEGRDRQRYRLLPACLDDNVSGDNPVRVVDAYIEELDIVAV